MNKLLQRNLDANKGDFGHVLIIGGDHNMGGSVIMAAEACFRSGAGKVTVLTRKENHSALLARLPNAMTVSDKESEKNIFLNKTVIVIGCGLGKSKWGKDLLKLSLKNPLPKIIDADALNIISEEKNKKINLENSIITPHAGEAARLLNITAEKVQNNRELSAKKLHEKYNAVTLLKGKGALIVSKKGKIYQCPYGNAGMATAGMGDALSGVVAALVAQGLSLEEAAIHSANIHAMAGDLVARRQGEIGMTPNDLILQIPLIIKDY